jgi:hypothetical protein
LNGRRKKNKEIRKINFLVTLFRHGRVQSVKIHDQHFAFVAFLDIRTALKAHKAENILDKQQLRTAFYDGSNSIPKVLLETSPGTSSIVEPFSSSPSSITTVTNTLIDKTTTPIHEDRDKRISRTIYSPEENTRWVVFIHFLFKLCIDAKGYA